jgi:hypothetical protein
MTIRLSKRERDMIKGILDRPGAGIEEFLCYHVPEIGTTRTDASTIAQVARSIKGYLGTSRLDESLTLAVDERYRQPLVEAWTKYLGDFGRALFVQFSSFDDEAHISGHRDNQRRQKVNAIHAAVLRFIEGTPVLALV